MNEQVLSRLIFKDFMYALSLQFMQGMKLFSLYELKKSLHMIEQSSIWRRRK